MATVRMSDKLKDEIRQEAARQFENVNPEQSFSLDIGDRVYNKYVEPLVQDINKIKQSHDINDSYLNMSESAEITVEIHHSFTKEKVTDGYIEPLKMSASRIMPGAGNSYTSTKCTFKLLHDSLEAVELLGVIKANEDIKISHRQYTRKVGDTLDNFTTLNQALKAWPGLEKLVTNDWAIQRVNEKITRRKKAQEQRQEIELDEVELNSVILTNSLIGED